MHEAEWNTDAISTNRAERARALVLCAGVAGLALMAGCQATSPAYQPAMEWGTCDFTEADLTLGATPLDRSRLKCGALVVPEDRAKPNGRKIRLWVAVLTAEHPVDGALPLVFVQGGPGVETMMPFASALVTRTTDSAGGVPCPESSQ